MAVPFPFVANAVLTAAQMNAITSLPTTAKTASATLTAAESVGYRVTMTSATATTITINTNVYATGDTVFITNLGAGVCTVTAGTATVSSAGSLAIPQYGSGLLVMTATGTGIYYPSAVTSAEPWTAQLSALASFGNLNWSTRTSFNISGPLDYVESTGAQNAYMEWKVLLSAGTWTFAMNHYKGAYRGIYTLTIDGGGSLGTIDGYNSSSIGAYSTITGIAVTTNTNALVRLTMGTKNASALGYYGYLCGIGATMARTA